MAFCPRCAGELGAADTACSRCGYDFPPYDPASPPVRRSGFAHSKVAHAALMAGAFVSGFGSVAALAVSVGAVWQGELFFGFVVGPSLSVFLLASLVVFLRMQE